MSNTAGEQGLQVIDTDLPLSPGDRLKPLYRRHVSRRRGDGGGTGTHDLLLLGPDISCCFRSSRPLTGKRDRHKPAAVGGAMLLWPLGYFLPHSPRITPLISTEKYCSGVANNNCNCQGVRRSHLGIDLLI